MDVWPEATRKISYSTSTAIARLQAPKSTLGALALGVAGGVVDGDKDMEPVTIVPSKARVFDLKQATNANGYYYEGDMQLQNSTVQPKVRVVLPVRAIVEAKGGDRIDVVLGVWHAAGKQAKIGFRYWQARGPGVRGTAVRDIKSIGGVALTVDERQWVTDWLEQRATEERKGKVGGRGHMAVAHDVDEDPEALPSLGRKSSSSSRGVKDEDKITAASPTPSPSMDTSIGISRMDSMYLRDMFSGELEEALRSQSGELGAVIQSSVTKSFSLASDKKTEKAFQILDRAASMLKRQAEQVTAEHLDRKRKLEVLEELVATKENEIVQLRATNVALQSRVEHFTSEKDEMKRQRDAWQTQAQAHVRSYTHSPSSGTQDRGNAFGFNASPNALGMSDF